MAPIIELETPRLRMRQWGESDHAPFAAMNADPAVMQFFASPPSRAASDASINAWQAQLTTQGWSNWAVELRESSEFIGFTGLSVPRRTFFFSPCVEAGWRLARKFWGKGFATEAARAALQVAFERLALPEVVSFAAVGNLRSRSVMERIGMRNSNQNFEHPGINEGHTAAGVVAGSFLFQGIQGLMNRGDSNPASAPHQLDQAQANEPELLNSYDASSDTGSDSFADSGDSGDFS